MTTVVPYEADRLTNDEPGLTIYDSGFPGGLFGAPVYHATDQTEDGIPRHPSDIVEWVELDQDIGGGTGLVDRNAFVLGGFDMPDAHDFRGDHPLVPRESVSGSYGDVGYGPEDYPTQYAQGIAAQDYETPSPEDSWDAVSVGY